jgi:hypothetical protein
MAGEKIKNLDEDEFVEKVLAYNEDVAKQAEAAGIDIRAFVIGTKSSVDKYGVSTGVAYANARLKEAVIEANSETIKGLIVGQRDRYGTNAPMRIPVLTSTGDNSEVILWGHTVKSGDSKIELPIPSVATMRVITEGDYKGVPNVRLVSIEKYDNLSIPDTVARLTKIAKSPGELGGEDELSVVVVKGRIAFITPCTKWKGKEKDGNWPVYLPNQRDNPAHHPVMQVIFETQSGNIARAAFDRNRNAVPTVAVEDLEEICQDALGQSTEPVEQARFVSNIFHGREVIIVGFMTKYSSQADVNYIDIGAYAIFDAAIGKQATLAPAKSAAKKPAPVEDDDEDEAEETPKAKPAAKKPAAKAGDDVKEKIRQYCDAIGIEPGKLPITDANKYAKLKEMFAPGKSDAFFRTVLDELKDE